MPKLRIPYFTRTVNGNTKCPKPKILLLDLGQQDFYSLGSRALSVTPSTSLKFEGDTYYEILFINGEI